MARPNFFCGIEGLQWLLENEPKAQEDDIDLTVDLIEAPYLFIYSSDSQAWSLKVMGRGELYDHQNGSGVEKGNLRVEKDSGQGSGTTRDPALRDNMGAFFEACRRLSRYIRDENLEPLYRGLDPEQAGVMLEVKDGRLKGRRVAGKERPEMMCSTLFGGNVMCRPYMDDFMERSAVDMMSVEDKIQAGESGDKFAMAQLAQAYLNGDDQVQQDPAKAAYWYRKEAELQESEGAFNLGLLYAKGFGVERDFTQAAEWMEKAVAWGDQDGVGPAAFYRKMAGNEKKARAGDAGAMAELAEGYMGLGGALDQAGPGEDYKLCLDWAQKAVDAGCAAGYWPLALAYEHGRGVEKDSGKATELYQKGAEAGNAPCQHSYGCRLIKGEGVKKDPKQALRLFEQSAAQGYALAFKALGHMYETGEGVEPDFDKELEYYEKACQAEPGDAEFLRHVGFQYTNLMDGDEEHWLRGVERAAFWLRKAADLGDRTAQGGAQMYERILKLHKEGRIPAGTDMGGCMSILSGDGPEEKKEQSPQQKQKEEEAARKRAEEAAARRKAEEAARKRAAEEAASKKAEEEAATIRETVRRARETARSAERTFDRRAAEIQRKTSTSLDLYSSDFEPRLREIARLSVEACKSLYDCYQDQIRKVDKACRPLLNGSRKRGEIQEIRDVIRWLNEESKIENNFSATLNQFNLGRLVQAKYNPASDCLAIQRFWEDKLKNTPKTPEELKAEQEERKRKEREAAERRKREEERRRAEEQRKQEAERREQERLRALQEKREEQAAQLRTEISQKEEAMKARRKPLEEEQKENEQKAAQLRQQKELLGFFAFKQKAQLQAQIDALQERSTQLKAEWKKILDDHDRETAETRTKLALLEAKAGTCVVMGSDPNPGGRRITWYIAGVQDNKVRMVAQHIMGYGSYYQAMNWLKDSFPEKAFSKQERAWLAPVDGSLADFPTRSDLDKIGIGVGAEPSEAFHTAQMRAIDEEARKYYYNRLQTENTIKDRETDMRKYWLKSSASGGWATIVYKGGGGSIGAGANFGIRPLIVVDLEKLV